MITPKSPMPRQVLCNYALSSLASRIFSSSLGERHVKSKYERKRERVLDSVSPAKNSAENLKGQLVLPSPTPGLKTVNG